MTPPVFVVDPADLAVAAAGSRVLLGGAEGRHAVSVRRLTAGQSVSLVDGAGRRAVGTVAEVVDRQTLAVAVDRVTDEAPVEPRLVVVQALAKGDRGELAVEQLTEVGVDEIVPWSAATSVVRWTGQREDRGRRRWSDAIVAAAKQARRTRFPVLAPLASTTDVADRIARATLALVLHGSADRPIAEVTLPERGEVLVVVGPEGGITSAEVDDFLAAGAHAVRLGPTILRTSSAGLVASAILLAGSRRWHPAAGAAGPKVGG